MRERGEREGDSKDWKRKKMGEQGNQEEGNGRGGERGVARGPVDSRARVGFGAGPVSSPVNLCQPG